MKRLFTLLLIAPLIASATITYEDFGAGLVYNLNTPVSLDMDNNGQVDFTINGTTGNLDITPIYVHGCYHKGIGTLFVPYNGGETFLTGSTMITEWEENVPAAFWTNTGGFNLAVSDGQDFYLRIMLYNVMMEGYIHIVIDESSQTLRILDWMYTDDASYEIGAAMAIPEEPVAPALNIYPNPVSSILIVEVDEIVEGTLELINITGQVCYSQQLNGILRSSINVAKFDAGIYFIRLTQGTIVSRKRVIIK
ncbi:MAG: T9SS type A sorting domain-containing protein [Flavobacteriales bacterium]|nr:T9SS type A sorting domain-containing protein [Flavobacteriales bacterium]